MNVNQRQPLFAFAGGGTGGHLYPMLSVAAEIRRRLPDARFTFFTTQRPIDERVIRSELSDSDTLVIPQPVKPIPQSIRGALGFVRAWRASVKISQDALRTQCPEVVLGSGGYGSAPPIRVAAKCGIPTALLNPDAIPGKANRYLAKRTDIVFTQWARSESHFAAAARVLTVGCPVRAAFANIGRAEGLRRFDLDPAKRTLLITGASQGARSINRAIALILDKMRRFDDWQYLHLAGPNDVQTLQNAYEAASLSAVVVAYTDDMPAALAAADLIVARAGASSLAEITAMGVPAVILPYPHHADRHQYANAAMLTEVGAALVVNDDVQEDKTAASLSATLLSLMADADRLVKMSQSATVLGETVASEKITDMLFALCGRRPDGQHKGKNVLHAQADRSENREGKKAGWPIALAVGDGRSCPPPLKRWAAQR